MPNISRQDTHDKIDKIDKNVSANNEPSITHNKSKNVTILLENNVSYNISQINSSKNNNTETNKSIFHTTMSKLTSTSKYLFESNTIFTHRFSLMDETFSHHSQQLGKNLDYRYSTSSGLSHRNQHHDDDSSHLKQDFLDEHDEIAAETEPTNKAHSESPNITTSNSNGNSHFVFKDGGSGWFVVIASCWCFGIIISMQNSYSLLYSSIIEKYQNETNHVAYAGVTLLF